MHQTMEDILQRADLETEDLLDIENITLQAKNNLPIMTKLYFGKWERK